MIANEDYKGNVLAITDEQVNANWRLGLLRSIGNVVSVSALPSDSTGSWGAPVSGSNRDHLSYQGFGSYGTRCSIVEVYDIKEDSYEEWEHNSFAEGGGNSRTLTGLNALATCACGRLVKHPVAMSIPVGELIYAVTQTEG